MFDEMEVDYSADDEVEALKSKVMLDVDANTILDTNMDAPLQTPGSSVLEKLALSENPGLVGEPSPRRRRPRP